MQNRASQKTRQKYSVGPQKGSATNSAGADQTMYFSGPFLCTFYLTNTDSMSDLIKRDDDADLEVMPSFDFVFEKETEQQTQIAEHRAWLKSIKHERPLPKHHFKVAVYKIGRAHV